MTAAVNGGIRDTWNHSVRWLQRNGRCMSHDMSLDQNFYQRTNGYNLIGRLFLHRPRLCHGCRQQVRSSVDLADRWPWHFLEWSLDPPLNGRHWQFTQVDLTLVEDNAPTIRQRALLLNLLTPPFSSDQLNCFVSLERSVFKLDPMRDFCISFTWANFSTNSAWISLIILIILKSK